MQREIQVIYGLEEVAVLLGVLVRELAVVTAPWEHLVRQSGVVAVNPRGILLDVWPTGGSRGSRASRLVAGISRAEDVGLDGTERLDLVVVDATRLDVVGEAVSTRSGGKS